MSQPGAQSRVVLALIWLVVGLAMVLVPLWLGVTRWSAILSGHPALLVAGIACGLFGFVALAWAVASLLIGDRLDRETDAEHHRRRTSAQLIRRARWRIVLAIPPLLLSVTLVAVLAYTRPLAATPEAVAALRSSEDVRIVERLGWYEMVPVREDEAGEAITPTTGLIFTPGARVDARAYARLLRPLAEDGYLVAVLKEPFGLSLIQRDHAGTVLDVHPDISYWALGGHSLGGVTAAGLADTDVRVDGLVLFAAYPAGPLRRSDLKVTSISGTADRLTTPAQVDASRANLPAGTSYVIVGGAVHSFFGDYGDQRGDGAPEVDREFAQAQIVTATRLLLTSLEPPPKKK